MSGRYWDFRTCSWQGGALDVSSELWLTAQQEDGLHQAVPAQPTAADAAPAGVLVSAS